MFWKQVNELVLTKVYQVLPDVDSADAAAGMSDRQTDTALKASSDLLILFTPPRRGAEHCDQCVCLSVCASVYPRADLWNRWTNPHKVL